MMPASSKRIVSTISVDFKMMAVQIISNGVPDKNGQAVKSCKAA